MRHPSTARWPIAALALVSCLATAAPVQEAVPGPRFDIARFAVEGNSLLSTAQINSALAVHVGRQRNFGDVQQAMRTLEKAYADAGWTAVQVSLPEQELTDAVVRLRVQELTLGEILVEGQKFREEGNVRRALPALVAGRAPNVDDIARNLRSANENPSRNITLILRAGARAGKVDAVAKVADQKPWSVTTSLDSTGTPATGILRLGLSAQHSNLFDRDHVISLQGITSPAYPSRVTIAGLGYRLPLHGLGDSIDLAYIHSDVDSGQVSTAAGTFAISGSGNFYSARYNFNLPNRGAWEQRLVLGGDWREYANSVSFNGSAGSLVPDLTVHPISLGYSGRRASRVDELALSFSVARNLPGGPDGGALSFTRTRAGATAAYTVWRASASYLRSLPGDWQGRIAFGGQYSADLLVPGEQFGLGGLDSVRGFIEREMASDRGLRGSLELYTPDPGWGEGSGLRARALLFADWGTIARNRPAPGEVVSETIASFGAGLRASLRQTLSVRLDLGRVYQAGGLQGKGDTRLQGIVTLSF